MENKNEPIGYLFGSIGYNSPNDVTILIDNLNKEQALLILTRAVDSAYEKGIYSLVESEILSKSIRILTLIPPTSEESK